jgi:hypothetical protein
MDFIHRLQAKLLSKLGYRQEHAKEIDEHPQLPLFVDGDLLQGSGLDAGIFSYTWHKIRSLLPEPGRPLDVLFYTARPEFFDSTDLIDRHQQINTIYFCSTDEQLLATNNIFDIAIICTHLIFEHKPAMTIRARDLAKLLVFWTWDNHHKMAENLLFNSLADLIIPAHGYVSNYLKTPYQILCRPFPLSSSQWSRQLVADLLPSDEPLRRSSALFGGYVLWDSDRNHLLRQIRESGIEQHLQLIPTDTRHAYFSKTPVEKCVEWMSHKVSLSLPLEHDLSLRVFDALLVGQIPLVPTWCEDLDSVIPPLIQEKLPVIRFHEATVESVAAAWRQALFAFDSDGAVGTLRRHNYALNQHHIAVRIRDMLEYITSFRDSASVGIVADDYGVGLVDMTRNADAFR